MKTLLPFLVFVSCTPAFAVPVGTKCYKNAAAAVEAAAETTYDRGGIRATGCLLASNKKVVLCEVEAPKGRGAAVDSYRVVLSANCSRVYRVDLVGEE
ncbi:MAG: hypothetical protein AB7H97_07210 [Pseudobdellovibrionaceae bacterium]